ncbi:MAG TPA: MurR/RpiR family transcriptional regulator [Enterococcus sp.]|nr:MurR/RpiR family transcriptional regulator [Enterococcus sp.]HPR81108.1 MurR/RpiR family transcriptional regulator [Enterococcus sp.]
MFDNEKVKTLNELEMLVYDYILKHREVVVEMSIRELSAVCHVSTATIVRVCHKLNLAGFSELKYVIKQKIEADTLYNLDYFYHETSQIDTFLKRVNQKSYRKILDIAIDMIVAANHIIFTGIGTSGILGMYGSRYFMNVGLNCYSLTDAFAPVSPRLQTNTLVIALSVSGETPEVLDQIKEFKQYGGTVLSITNDEHSTIARFSDYNLSYYMPEVFYGRRDDLNITTQVPVITLLEVLAQEASHKIYLAKKTDSE